MQSRNFRLRVGTTAEIINEVHVPQERTASGKLLEEQ